MNEKQLLINFIASLTLCDHMGDVKEDMKKVLKELGVEHDWQTHSQDELIQTLKENFDEVGTLYGTDI